MVNITDEQPEPEMRRPDPMTPEELAGLSSMESKEEMRKKYAEEFDKIFSAYQSAESKDGFFANMNKLQVESDRKSKSIDENFMDQMKIVSGDYIDAPNGEVYDFSNEREGLVFSGENRIPSVTTDPISPFTEVSTRPFVHEQPELMSFGQKAVCVSLNTSGDYQVFRLKMFYAEIIDCLNDFRGGETATPEQKRLASIAITEAQTAQMWAVKAVTWKD